MSICLVIAGPTASGKSWLAERIAQIIPATIINADSMQVYKGFPVLTAQPEISDNFALYGYRSPEEAYSVANWLNDASRAIEQSFANNQLPIVVGGTGFYINALINGIAKIPEISKKNRNKARTLLDQQGPQVLSDILFACDPKSKARIRPSDSQRLSRAYEVWLETGKSIFDWQSDNESMISCTFLVVKLTPSKQELDERIATRFDDMLDNGAIDEAKLAASLNLSDSAAKIIGVREINRFLNDEISLEQARELSIIASRQYAKRQLTWFRNKLESDITITKIPDQKDVEEISSLILSL